LIATGNDCPTAIVSSLPATPARPVVLGALGLLTALAWCYLAWWPMPMPDAAGVATLSYLILSTLMWSLMMVAMMAPAVVPVILLFDRAARHGHATAGRTSSFVAGYFSAWAGFSLAVSALQILLIQLDWIDTMGIARHWQLSAALLILVGIYQWLPVKLACLRHCQSPVHVLAHSFRAGRLGAWRMGLEHGLYCVGCCWLAMLLLFIGGVMNLWWIAGIAVAVSIEKLVPNGYFIARLLGMLSILGGIGVLMTH